ncbi:MAG: PDZ domain-containing protein, partial [Planctomycetales bacterium]|nr:PDZ domain-containing protein [Planctomycetales bacterium]
NVTADSPAWKAGFAINDRIQAINGFAITNLDGMVQQLDKTLPGQTAKFLVSRDGRYVELIAVLMERDLASRIAGSEPPSEEAAGPAWLGVVSSDLSPSFRSQFGIRVFRGAAVTNVSSGSPASKAGLRAGDAIVSIGGKSIENERELTAWLGQARPGTRVEIGYYRGGISQKADVTLEVSPAAKAERVPPPATARSAAATAAAAGVESLVPQIPSSPSPPANSSQLELKPPTAPAPAKDSDAGQPSVVELQQEVKRLQEALRAANARLEATQRKLQQIAEGLGGKQ